MIHRLIPIAHIDQIVSAARRPGIRLFRMPQNLGCSDPVPRIPGHRQFHFGRTLFARGRSVPQSADIQAGFTRIHSGKTYRHRFAFFSNFQGEFLSALNRDRFPLVLDLHRDAHIREGKSVPGSIARRSGSCGLFLFHSAGDLCKSLSGIRLQKDPLHKSLLTLRNIHRVIFFPADPLVRGKPEGKRVLVFVDFAGIPVQTCILRP